ncbi:MAG: hypothetical protein HYS26_03715 [Candidatus Kaiserbacteria bacterium]|nr:MAG: hypothetical protein HYS26_03715 [Candidatus Kaiserbacteria bacterium]
MLGFQPLTPETRAPLFGRSMRSNPKRVYTISPFNAALIVLDFRGARLTVDNVAKLMSIPLAEVEKHRSQSPEFASWLVG